MEKPLKDSIYTIFMKIEGNSFTVIYNKRTTNEYQTIVF